MKNSTFCAPTGSPRPRLTSSTSFQFTFYLNCIWPHVPLQVKMNLTSSTKFFKKKLPGSSTISTIYPKYLIHFSSNLIQINTSRQLSKHSIQVLLVATRFDEALEHKFQLTINLITDGADCRNPFATQRFVQSQRTQKAKRTALQGLPNVSI